MINTIKNLFTDHIEMLYGEKEICYVCGKKEDYIDKYICDECRYDLNFVGHNKCSVCGRPFKKKMEGLYHCIDCEKYRKEFTKAIAPLIYDKKTRTIINNFKNNDRLQLKKLLGEFIVGEIINSDLEEVDMVVPVPMYIKRENERGYNQSRLLAEYISIRMNKSLEINNLVKIRDTKKQKQLRKTERETNIRNSLEVLNRNAILNKVVLLIDDIYTTGATVNECSKKLKEHGAKDVYVATVAIIKDNRF